MEYLLLIYLSLFSQFAFASAELPCEGFFNNPNAFHSFEFHKDLTCIARVGFKPYQYEENKCTLSYDDTKKSWFINSREVNFASDCSKMSFFKWVFRSEPSLPQYPSAPFPAPVGQLLSTAEGKNYSKVINSIVKLGTGCTGTWLSNDGHLLTAVHCLIPELEKNGIGKIISEGEAIRSNARIGYRALQTTNFAPVRLTPAETSQSGLLIEGIADDRPRLVAVGPGGLSHRPFLISKGEWNVTKDQLGRAQMYEFEYVILKYEVGSNQTPCANLRVDALEAEEQIRPMGFVNTLNRDTNAYERILVSSSGHVYDKITSVKMAAPHLVPSEQDYAFMKNSPGLFYSDARTSQGMSGGPAFDSRGRIVGITSFGVDRNFKNISEQSGFVSVSAMYQELESKLSPVELKNIFKCN